MIDVQLLRNDLDFVYENLNNRGFELNRDEFNELHSKFITLLQEKQDLETQRNALSKNIGILKSQKKDTDALFKEVESISNALKLKHNQFQDSKIAIDTFLSFIPNVCHSSVPIGQSEDDNAVLSSFLDDKCFKSDIDHISIGEKFSGMDFELGSSLSKSRFVVLKGPIAKLHRAITQFMLDIQTQKNGYQECYVPIVVNLDSMYNTGQLPKFIEDQFIFEKDKLGLIPTAEVPLTNFIANKIIQPEDLPMKLTAHTPCFRREAGSYGKDTKGMIRQHQFDKVELVQIVHPDSADSAFKDLVANAESILQLLELPYRKVMLCTGDIGFSAHRTIDLEVWLPGQNAYREISSCSHCHDFQARRMQARFKENGKTRFVHTLNGSGLAVGRTLIAVLENYFDGTVLNIPSVLQPYMGGISVLKPK